MRFPSSGDTSNQIHFEGMMVSDQCSALVREGLISALPGSPELAWVSESTEEKPLPGLYFEAVGQDGVHRKYNARPLPVDHILVSVSSRHVTIIIPEKNDPQKLIFELNRLRKKT